MTAWLVDTFLATSALALLVLLVREPVRRLFGSRVTYALWLIPAARIQLDPCQQHGAKPEAPVIEQLDLVGQVRERAPHQQRGIFGS